MFGMGIWEFVVLLVVGLMVLGPERLPKLARQIGRGLREFRRAAMEMQASFVDIDVNNQPVVPPTLRPPSQPPQAVDESDRPVSSAVGTTEPSGARQGDDPQRT